MKLDKKKLEIVSIIFFITFTLWSMRQRYKQITQDTFEANSIDITDSYDLYCTFSDIRKGKSHISNLSIGHHTKEFNHLVELVVDNELVYWTTQEGKQFLTDNWTKKRANDCASMIFRITILGYKPFPKYLLPDINRSPDLIISPQPVYDFAGMDVCYEKK
jgi:hypothetical protein